MPATTTPTITAAWTALVAAGDDFLLTLPYPCGEVDVATTDGADAPTVTVGHRLTYLDRVAGKDSMSRALIGPGNVWAKSVSKASVDVAFPPGPPPKCPA